MRPDPSHPLLAIDSASPLLSVAIGTRDETLSVRDSPASRSSAALMGLVDASLDDAGVQPSSLAGVVVLSGPGSFTGLRVGMSVALGLHQALGLPAAALSSFRALAAQAPDRDRRVLALVRALRGEWYVQGFPVPDGPAADPQRLMESELLELAPGHQLVGFETGELARQQAGDMDLDWVVPGPLAEAALGQIEHAQWGPATLTEPAYLAPPPVGARRGSPSG